MQSAQLFAPVYWSLSRSKSTSSYYGRNYHQSTFAELIADSGADMISCKTL
jgi:hypothetical protein